jgi:hypothetical protein
MMQKYGVKFTAQQDMIWKSVKLFWIAKGCHHQLHQRHKSPGEAIITGKIPMMTSKWLKSARSSEVACQSPPKRKGRSCSGRSVWLSESSQEEE